jgi:hypothetical protein
MASRKEKWEEIRGNGPDGAVRWRVEGVVNDRDHVQVCLENVKD